MSFLTGAHRTPFGRLEGSNTLDLMARSAQGALDDAELERGDIDVVLCGYSTALPHLMLSSLFCEHFGLKPKYAHSVQLGGATGSAMVMLAHELVDTGRYSNVLVVAGENRLTGQSRDNISQVLAQVGHIDYEVPLGAGVPSYYALVASRYQAQFGLTSSDMAEFAVLMRRHAALTEGAQFREPIDVADVVSSRLIASPLRLLDCCATADGSAAVIVSGRPGRDAAIRIRGGGQAHLHQHVTAMTDIGEVGAALAMARASEAAGMTAGDVHYLAIYDSFTITLAMLLEEMGFAPRGKSGELARAGVFDIDGEFPLNTHGGLLSYGHCGVAGAMAHLVEVYQQMRGRAGGRQVRDPSTALFHSDGGTLSAHVSLFLERTA